MQVPRSSKLIYEDNDYALYSVTLFKRVADSFKQAARSKGFQVLAKCHPSSSFHESGDCCLLDTFMYPLIIMPPFCKGLCLCVTQCCMVVLQVRDYEFDQEMQSSQSEAAKGLKASADKKRKQLEEWSASAYGEVIAPSFLA